MATAEQLKALIRSHAAGDHERFYSVAMQVAARAAHQGHGRYARDLKALVDQVRESTGSLGASRPPGGKKGDFALPEELGGILSLQTPGTLLQEMVLDEKLAERLAQVVTEQRQRHRLEEFGLKPMRKLLLMGPPGTGKTMTASALAGELCLPLLTIQLDGLISRFLGETAAKLRLVFDVMSTRRGVYFFDEFDALGAERGDRQDVGEIRRVLNSFLQFLEQDPSDSLVLAATNHGAMLDRALFRRFDAVLPYTIPTASTAAKVMQARLGFLETSSLDWEIAAQHGHGLSHAELVLACEQAAKQTVLSNRSSLRQSDLEQALERMRSRYPQEMSSFAQ